MAPKTKERPADWPAPVYSHPLPQLLHDIGAGRAPVPTSTARRHHYVPQLVLRGFESTVKPGHVHQLDTTTGKTVASPIKTTAYEKRLYAGKDESGEWDNTLEGLLAIVEGYSGEALRFLFETGVPPTEDETLPIPLLMALQMMRSPTALDSIGADIETSGQRALSALLADPRAFRRMYRSVHPDRNDVELEQLHTDAVRLFADGAVLRLAGQRDAAIEMMCTILLDVALSLAHADWWVLRSDDAEFVTNDVGFARCVESDDVAIPHGVVFPFRRDRCVVVTPPTSPTDGLVTRTKATKRVVEHMNLRVYGWASQFVFGASQHAVQTVRASAKAQPRRARAPTTEQRRPTPP